MKKSLLAALFLVASSMAHAEINIKDSWVRATVPQQRATGAFMQITSTTNVRLIEAQSSIARSVEIHEMKMDNNVMKMREISGVDIAAGKTLELKPGSYHIMFMDLKQQVKEGDAIPLKLVFEAADKQRETIDITAYGRPLTTPAASTGTAPDAHGKHVH